MVCIELLIIWGIFIEILCGELIPFGQWNWLRLWFQSSIKPYDGHNAIYSIDMADVRLKSPNIDRTGEPCFSLSVQLDERVVCTFCTLYIARLS
jgi:hypothetical protein